MGRIAGCYSCLLDAYLDDIAFFEPYFASFLNRENRHTLPALARQPPSELRAPPVFSNHRLQGFLSRLRSATSLRSFVFSSRSCLVFCAWLTLIPPYVLRFPRIDRVLRHAHHPPLAPRPPLSDPPPVASAPRSSALPCACFSTYALPLSFAEIILSSVRKEGIRSLACGGSDGWKCYVSGTKRPRGGMAATLRCAGSRTASPHTL